jgi:hypothetical protein
MIKVVLLAAFSRGAIAFRLLPALLVLVATVGLAPAATTLRVLMLGNSYTDSGTTDQQVWLQLKNFLDADPDYYALITRRAPGGYQLYNHANDPASTNLIVAQGPWDYVILQDQSYTPSHAWLYGGAWWNTFDWGISPLTEMAKAAGAKVIYFQTWARGAGETGVLAANYGGSPSFMQDNLTAAYGLAATYYGVKVAPVGEAWEKSLALSSSLGLHQADLSHMNNRGAYLAAAVFYRTITGQNPSLVGYTSTLPVSEAYTLRGNLSALPAQPNLAIDPTFPAGQVFRVSTLAASGSTLGVVRATAYQPPSGAYVEDPHPRIVRYEIKDGNTAQRFALNQANGVLSLAGPPVPCTNTLGIRVTDSNNWQTNNTVQAVVYTHPYHAWLASFPGALARPLPGEDPDGDGFLNALEFAFGSAPDSGAAVREDGFPLAPVAEIAAGQLIVSYFRRVAPADNGLNYTLQVAASAAAPAWTTPAAAGISTTETELPHSSGWKRVTVRFAGVPAAQNKLFIRVAIQILP